MAILKIILHGTVPEGNILNQTPWNRPRWQYLNQTPWNRPRWQYLNQTPWNRPIKGTDTYTYIYRVGYSWFGIVKDKLFDNSLLKFIQNNVNTTARVHPGVQR